jgi:hypothetical protein
LSVAKLGGYLARVESKELNRRPGEAGKDCLGRFPGKQPRSQALLDPSLSLTALGPASFRESGGEQRPDD